MLIKTIKTEKLDTFVYDTRKEMGDAAGMAAAEAIKKILSEKEYANVIFAAAPSQNEALDALVASDVDFSRVNAFHMDEYIGLADEFIDQRFAKYLEDHIFGLVPFKSVNLINCSAENYEEECERYSALLRENPVYPTAQTSKSPRTRQKRLRSGIY